MLGLCPAFSFCNIPISASFSLSLHLLPSFFQSFLWVVAHDYGFKQPKLRRPEQ
uniref:Uncharacterized protein n=1 Tax=Rhizophora mucronata TaxID=61149 RepID=A0A2P2J851_RHIMU